MKINLRESLNKIDLATDNKYDLLNTFDSKKLSDENKKKLAEAIENNSMASVNRILHESEEQLFKVVIQSGATKRDFESALYEDEAEEIVDYYGGRWIDENGFEWNMYVEEDDDSTEHAMVDNSYDIEYDDEVSDAWADMFDIASPQDVADSFKKDVKSKNKIYKPISNEGFDESLTEASYGGAYDIEDDMFFTKEEIVEFADEICEYLGDIFGYQYDINNVYMDGPRKLYINIYDNNYIEVESTFGIDMRKIRKPSDLSKVYGLTIKNWFQKAFAREYVDPRDFMTAKLDGKGYDFDGDAFKEKAMAAPIVYFVVDEDTGFIDWGPEDNEIAAKDFLNGKKEDWENDMDESLNENKELEEYYTVNLHYEDIGDGKEYDYEADYDDVLEYLMEICVDDNNAPEDTQEYMEWVVTNFDYLFKKYEYDLLKHFYEDASQEEYDERHSSYEPEYDPMD